jgi:predicted SAM-dependent methyltransferase
MATAFESFLTPQRRSMLRKKLIEMAFLPARPFRQLATPLLMRRYDKLHLGSGARLLDGWANVDIGGVGTLLWDLRNPLPLKDKRVRLVYTEHFIEHIEREDAARLLGHARQAMAPGAVLRVSTPDLRKLADDYLNGRVIQMPHGGWFPETPCQMLNQGVRWWGHLFLYDEQELVRLLSECGYSDIRRVSRGESEHPELCDLESRPDFGDLIVEARA